MNKWLQGMIVFWVVYLIFNITLETGNSIYMAWLAATLCGAVAHGITVLIGYAFDDE